MNHRSPDLAIHRQRMPRPIAAILALWLLAAATLEAQLPSGFLLRHRVRLVKVDQGVDFTTERVIFRDGLIVTTSSGRIDTLIQRRKATPEALRRLHAAFRQYHIGAQVGDCSNGSGPFDFASSTYTWLTGGPTGHTFRIGDPFTESCGPGLNLLLTAISDFVLSATPEPGLQDVLVPN